MAHPKDPHLNIQFLLQLLLEVMLQAPVKKPFPQNYVKIVIMAWKYVFVF